jgi:hypothetical protein
MRNERTLPRLQLRIFQRHILFEAGVRVFLDELRDIGPQLVSEYAAAKWKVDPSAPQGCL